jgi:hypothetical protein
MPLIAGANSPPCTLQAGSDTGYLSYNTKKTKTPFMGALSLNNNLLTCEVRKEGGI